MKIGFTTQAQIKTHVVAKIFLDSDFFLQLCLTYQERSSLHSAFSKNKLENHLLECVQRVDYED